ncbi:enoyl-CoA hydratase-related protein [Nocardia sp. NPDC024068]|uniref:enoyl-CoA hydratase-related protein n=1 Tax=Nocardia sp. NPDC024068 TaxID=3157197 RepID=UPI0033C64AC6
MTYQFLSVTDNSAPGVRVVRIDRPEAKNALDLATKRELIDALTDAGSDRTVRVLVLTGSAEVFVAGTDIKEMASLSPTDHIVEETGRVFDLLDDFGKPTIAAVDGYALGGGCELAMACDLVVAGRSAKLGQPEIRVGLIPGSGGVSRLVQRMGRARALALVLTGDLIEADTAFLAGIVSTVCPDREAERTAVDMARGIASKPQLNVRAIRKIARAAENAPLRTSLDLERSMFQTLFDTEDHLEGLTAFIQKRDPAYEGR